MYVDIHFEQEIQTGQPCSTTQFNPESALQQYLPSNFTIVYLSIGSLTISNEWSVMGKLLLSFAVKTNYSLLPTVSCEHVSKTFTLLNIAQIWVLESS